MPIFKPASAEEIAARVGRKMQAKAKVIKPKKRATAAVEVSKPTLRENPPKE